MGKKVEKGQNKDKNVSSADTDNPDDDQERSPGELKQNYNSSAQLFEQSIHLQSILS